MIILTQYSVYISIVLIFIVVILLGWVIFLHIKVKNLLRGKSGKDLESYIVETNKAVKENAIFERKMEEYLLLVEKRLRKSIQSVETIKFDAFKGMGSGGNQSFATAYLNENGDGLILLSINARERISLFSKPIKNFKSSLELSPEEKEALESARTKLLTTF